MPPSGVHTRSTPTGPACTVWPCRIDSSAVGGGVTATPQPYGTAFAQGATGEAVHLLLDDGWQRELDARPVQAAAAARS